jgi:hypothetical protein
LPAVVAAFSSHLLSTAGLAKIAVTHRSADISHAPAAKPIHS